MKKLLRFVWITLCVIFALIFLLSCCSAYVSPYRFSFMPLFALAFPYLFTGFLIICIVNLFINKKTAVVLFICFLAGLPNFFNTVALNVPSSFNKQKNAATLRVLTWNVEDFVDYLQNADVSLQMLDVIAKQNADIVCFQEFTNVDGVKHPFSIRQKMDSLGYKFCLFSKDIEINAGAYGVTTRGSAIFSKLPFTDSNKVNIRKEVLDESFISASIVFNNKSLNVYTAHLASFMLYRDTDNVNKSIYHITYTRKHAIEYQLRETEQVHVREATIIRAAIKKDSLPVIYCGDMNSVPSSYTYHFLKDDLQDAFLKKGFGLGNTFYKLIPTLRIDYLLADDRLKVVQCAVIKQKLSDHYPLITDLQWK